RGAGELCADRVAAPRIERRIEPAGARGVAEREGARRSDLTGPAHATILRLVLQRQEAVGVVASLALADEGGLLVGALALHVEALDPHASLVIVPARLLRRAQAGEGTAAHALHQQARLELPALAQDVPVLVAEQRARALVRAHAHADGDALRRQLGDHHAQRHRRALRAG